MTVRVVADAVGRFGKRPESLLELMTEAAELATEQTGRKTIDLLVVGHMAGGTLAEAENTTSQLADRLGLEQASGFRVEAASATGAAAFHAAAQAIASGAFERALVVAAEKMTGRSTAEVAKLLSRSLAPAEQAVGATMPGLAALVAQRVALRSPEAPLAWAHVSVQARACAASNPQAHFREPVTVPQVDASRPIALPLRLLHCSAVSDGAAAVVLERGEGPAQVLGLGEGFDSLSIGDRADLTSFRATRVAAQRAYEAARLTRKSVEFAELHDAFAPFALIDLEDVAICGPGEAGEWFTRGWTSPEGRFPVNPSGGLLGRGHPVGASGLAQIAEVSRQLRGESGPRSLPKRPRIGLAQSIGGLATHNFVTILGGSAPA
ncbi:MAG: thiolase family protein [Thermoplasmata archaeon]|nr:thiolase family protein [Thermoplasmata archaeon]